MLADGSCHCQDILQIGRAILVRRRTDGDQLEQTVVYPLLGVGREVQSAALDVAGNDGLKTRLVNGQYALFEHGDLVLVHVNTDHMVAGIRKACARHQAHVT